MNHLVLSGTATHVPSGTKASCYRGPESRERVSCSTAYRARNFSNCRILRILSNGPATFQRCGDAIIAHVGGLAILRLLKLTKRVAHAARAIGLTSEVPRQGERVVTIKVVVQFQRSDVPAFPHRTHDTFALRPAADTTSNQGARRKLTVVWRGSAAFGVPNRYPTHKTFDATGGVR